MTVPGTGTISHLGNCPAIGINSIPDGQVVIQENNMCKNTGSPLYITNNNAGAGGISITDNLIDDNGTGSTGSFFSQIDNATVDGNTITRHVEGLSVWYGIYLSNSDNNTISNNIIKENYIGIGIDFISRGNMIINNVISYNVLDGIIIQGDDNYILGNTISYNAGSDLCGISIGVTASGNIIHFNNIIGNSNLESVGVNNESPGIVDARWNWWGNISGPYNATTNPDGTGDTVGDNINYAPWLKAPINGAVGQNGINGEIDGRDATDTWVNVHSGIADVYMSKYSSNPGSSSFSGATGQYIDVLILNPVGVSEVEIRLYYTNTEVVGSESNLRLRWWDGTTWQDCSDTGVNTDDIPGTPYSGYIWVKIRPAADPNPTIPTLEQITGTPFGGGGVVPTIGTPGVMFPIISNVSYSYVAGNNGTVDIYWTTDKPSDSQVQYWASPIMYSYLETNFVTDHHIRLTGLSDNTTYHFQTMSRDMLGNLSISGEYTFTTLGLSIVIGFSSSNLLITPSQVYPGETITIALSVTNTGNIEGSHRVTLMINGILTDETTITLALGITESVSFSVVKDVVGTYSISVDGLTGSFTVVALPTTPTSSTTTATSATLTATAPASSTTEQPVEWTWIWITIMAVLVGGGLILLLARRR